MKYIFGLGLPRTGTNSLGLALHNLDINGECKCILNDFHNKREKDNNNGSYKYIIYNDAYQDLNLLLDEDKIYDNKYIVTVRDNEEWQRSIAKFDKDVVEELSKMNMEIYTEKLKYIFDLKQCSGNLLVLNVFEEDDEVLWRKIYEFLDLNPDEDIIEDEFPKLNLNA